MSTGRARIFARGEGANARYGFRTVNRLLLILCVAPLLSLAACRGAHLAAGGGVTPRRPTRIAPVATRPVRQAVRPGRVSLTPRDLAPVDAYLHARNSQWILGDYVEIHASREYFATALTVNARVGVVQRRDQEVGGDSVITLTYVGHPQAASAMANPRVLLGTGITVTARKRLTIRMVKTRDSRRPVYLRVMARGNATRGRREEVAARGDSLQIGGSLQLCNCCYSWFPIK